MVSGCLRGNTLQYIFTKTFPRVMDIFKEGFSITSLDWGQTGE